MRSALLVASLVAAVGAGTVSHRVSVGGSVSGGESLSVSETSSSISNESGSTTLGIRSSFSSSPQQSVVETGPRRTTTTRRPRPRPVTTRRPRPRPVTTRRPRPRPVTTRRPRPRPVTTKKPRPVAAHRPRPVAARPVTGTSTSVSSVQSSLGGAIPVVPHIRPLKPISIDIPSVGAVGGGVGTRFDNRPRPAAAAGVAPALAVAQANLNQAAEHLSQVASSLGV